MRIFILILLLFVPIKSYAQSFDPRMPDNVQYDYHGFEGQLQWGNGAPDLSGTYSATGSCLFWNFLGRDETLGIGPDDCTLTTASPGLWRMWPFDIYIKRFIFIIGDALANTDSCGIQFRKTITTEADTNVGAEFVIPLSTNTTPSAGEKYIVEVNEVLLAYNKLFMLGRNGDFCGTGSGCVCSVSFGRHSLYIEYVPGVVK